MANMMTLADLLQNLPDDQLQATMQSKSPSVPQFLVLSEMQRRKAMREEAAGPPPPPKSTVADDIMMSGVAATPQMSQGGVDGASGIASFAGGGEVRGFPHSNYPSGGPGKDGALEEWLRERGYGGAIAHMKERKSAIADGFGKFKDYMGDRIDELKRAPQDIVNFTNMPAGALGEKLDSLRMSDTIKNDTGIPNVPPFLDVVRAGYDKMMPRATAAEAAQVAGPQPQAPVAPERVPNPLAVEEVPAPAPVRSGGGGGGRGVASLIAPAPAMPSTDTRAVEQAAASLEGLQRPEPVAMPAPPKLSDYEAMLERVRKESPDVYADLMASNAAQMEDTKKDKKRAVSMALMQTGLGIMASKNNSVLGALGEGGMSGVKLLGEQMADVRRQQTDLRRHEERLKIGQMEAQRGHYRTAAEMKKAVDDEAKAGWDMQYKNAKEANDARTDDYRTERQIRADNLRFQQQQAAEEGRFARMQYSQGQQNARSAASIAARKSGGGGGRAAKADDPVKLETQAYDKFNKAVQAYEKANKPAFAKPEQLAQLRRDAQTAVLSDPTALSPTHRAIIERGKPAASSAAEPPKKKINWADIK